jgi:hypothetical protein
MGLLRHGSPDFFAFKTWAGRQDYRSGRRIMDVYGGSAMPSAVR